VKTFLGFSFFLFLSIAAHTNRAFADILAPDGEMTAKQFFAWCKNPPFNSPQDHYCSGYINGVFDGALNMDAIHISNRWLCPPNHLKLADLNTVVRSYMIAHPETEEKAEDSSAVVLTAFYAAFACH
jgi:hypothetical protein